MRFDKNCYLKVLTRISRATIIVRHWFEIWSRAKSNKLLLRTHGANAVRFFFQTEVSSLWQQIDKTIMRLENVKEMTHLTLLMSKLSTRCAVIT